MTSKKFWFPIRHQKIFYRPYLTPRVYFYAFCDNSIHMAVKSNLKRPFYPSHYKSDVFFFSKRQTQALSMCTCRNWQRVGRATDHSESNEHCPWAPHDRIGKIKMGAPSSSCVQESGCLSLSSHLLSTCLVWQPLSPHLRALLGFTLPTSAAVQLSLLTASTTRGRVDQLPLLPMSSAAAELSPLQLHQAKATLHRVQGWEREDQA